MMADRGASGSMLALADLLLSLALLSAAIVMVAVFSPSGAIQLARDRALMHHEVKEALLSALRDEEFVDALKSLNSTRISSLIAEELPAGYRVEVTLAPVPSSSSMSPSR